MHQLAVLPGPAVVEESQRPEGRVREAPQQARVYEGPELQGQLLGSLGVSLRSRRRAGAPFVEHALLLFRGGGF